MNNKGYTLIEMLVAMAIFSILIVTVMNTFMKGFYYQKKIVEMQMVQREEAYLMETVSREIRMASGKPTVEGLNGTRLDFTDHNGNALYYCLASESGVCNSTSGKSFSANGSVVNSTDVEVVSLKFMTSASFTDTQPLVTITMQVRAKKDPSVSAVLQTSVAMRLY